MGRTIEFNGQSIDADALLRALDRVDCEESLYTFVQYAWRFIDASPFSPGFPLEAVCEHLEAVCDGEIRRLIINIPPRCAKSSITSVCFPAWIWAQPLSSPTSGPGVSFLTGSYAEKLALRDSVKTRRLIEGPWYQSQWGDRFKLTSDQNTKSRYENDKNGTRLITAVDAGVTGEGGNIIIIDDPNSAQKAFSESSIQTTIEWWDQAMPTRLNDPKTGAFIIIQQRLSEEDLSGYILDKSADDWTHLVLPMRYEPERSFSTLIGWKDPRTEPGELLWPERFGEAEVAHLETQLGPWGCNPAEAPILMADLSMAPISLIAPGDKIVGFRKNVTKQGRAFGRHALTEATVTEVHKHIAPVVKMTLEGGEVIRCTRDHKWFMKDRGPRREMYGPVTMRKGTASRLARVCPARLPDLSPEDQRLAGWVAGFFDGDGSVSLQRRKGADFATGTSICFYQGAGRNLPLCQKLERALAYFGFEFNYIEDERKSNKGAPCYGYRQYRIKSEGLVSFQRFLHIIQPEKWRDRLISAAFRANFIRGRERVVSIEPDGEETVYALTTTTGNYVVWGLASSNSAGQLQQRPEPKGGGIIKRDWWKLWEHASYPAMDYIVASLDTAYTTKSENDPSAMTCWGVYSGDMKAQNSKSDTGGGVIRTYSQQPPRVMMMYAWQQRLELHELVIKVVETCRSMRVDKLLIENKASGHSVAQELRRLFSNENFAVQLVDPQGSDKLARLYSVQHLFAEGMVFAPDKQWAEMVMAQVGTFPRGKHDDLVDTVSMCLRHLRDLGLLTRAPEMHAEIERAMAYPGKAPPPLYGVP